MSDFLSLFDNIELPEKVAPKVEETVSVSQHDNPVSFDYEIIKDVVFARMNKNNTLQEYEEECLSDYGFNLNDIFIKEVKVLPADQYLHAANNLLEDSPLWKINGENCGGSSLHPEKDARLKVLFPELDTDSDFFKWPKELRDFYCNNSVYECLKIVNKDTGEFFFVNPEGYNYAHYVGFPKEFFKGKDILIPDMTKWDVFNPIDDPFQLYQEVQEDRGVNCNHSMGYIFEIKDESYKIVFRDKKIETVSSYILRNYYKIFPAKVNHEYVEALVLKAREHQHILLKQEEEADRLRKEASLKFKDDVLSGKIYSYLKKFNDFKNISSHALAAKNIKLELKHHFPGIDFKVQSDSYSGGSSVDVTYTDGPLESNIDKYIKKYTYCRFNGMDDSFEYDNTNADFHKFFGSAKYVSASRNYSAEFKNKIMSEYNLAKDSDELYRKCRKFSDYQKPDQSKEPEKDSSISNSSYHIKINEILQGIEVYFSKIPSQEIRNSLKSKLFRWSNKNKCWYHKYTIKNKSDLLNYVNNLLFGSFR